LALPGELVTDAPRRLDGTPRIERTEPIVSNPRGRVARGRVSYDQHPLRQAQALRPLRSSFFHAFGRDFRAFRRRSR
jgi:hypothetical protein